MYGQATKEQYREEKFNGIRLYQWSGFGARTKKIQRIQTYVFKKNGGILSGQLWRNPYISIRRWFDKD